MKSSVASCPATKMIESAPPGCSAKYVVASYTSPLTTNWWVIGHEYLGSLLILRSTHPRLLFVLSCDLFHQDLAVDVGACHAYFDCGLRSYARLLLSRGCCIVVKDGIEKIFPLCFKALRSCQSMVVIESRIFFRIPPSIPEGWCPLQEQDARK